MARNIDIGGYFDKLTKKGQGGRRLDGTAGTEYPDADPGSGSLDDAFEPAPQSTRGGSLKDILRDTLGKGRSTAKRTAEKVSTKATESAAKRRRDQLPPEGVVHVEYSPQEDGDPDPGEVVWTWVPFEEDPTQGKDRPVVIIGRRSRKLVGIPLTTKADDREAQIDLGTGDWDPKRRPSYARIWRMLDIDPDKTRREGATLDIDRFKQLIAAVDHYYDIKLPASGPRSTPTSSKADDYDY